MNQEVKTSWRSQVYSSYSAEEWFFLFRRSHTRATDTLMRICGKYPKDVINLAQYSQVGWELFKTAVKKIETVQKAQKYAIDERVNQNFKDLFRISIQTLSSSVVKWVRDNQFSYEKEAEYLTRWFEKII